MTRKVTTKEFIERAVSKHGPFYDYSELTPTYLRDKVIIKCPEHGIFMQRASRHLYGSGCPTCNRKREKRITTEEFISKAISVHGNKFDYSKTEYHRGHENVRVICSKHGEFFRNATELLSGKGCPLCGREIAIEKTKLTQKEFIDKANRIHKNKYDYSKTKYNKYLDKICIICNIHGEFFQTAGAHLAGSGCTKCGIFYSTEEFIEKANKIHGQGRYNYSKTNYKSCNKRVQIICPKHGEFWQVPRQHIRGFGCPKCAVEKAAITKRKTT